MKPEHIIQAIQELYGHADNFKGIEMTLGGLLAIFERVGEIQKREQKTL